MPLKYHGIFIVSGSCPQPLRGYRDKNAIVAFLLRFQLIFIRMGRSSQKGN
ncbi:hypothetical protein D3C87_144210 [compost metagenome]